MKVEGRNSVIIFNKMLESNRIVDVEEMSKRVYEIERSIDVNVIEEKRGKIISCSENERLVMKNVYGEYMGKEGFILGEKKLELSGIKRFDRRRGYVGDKVYELKSE